MIPLIFGVSLIGFGICLIADLGGVAHRIFDFYASFMNPGRATVNAFRLVGVFGVLVGSMWVAASFSVK
ncbi:hypothetical protein [Streptomyces sp. RG80]|uniref:hypothetical protein n=1 Tax=Streptomyces sp. RG80 TaxID=3157340 RepID=UPI00339071D6